MPCPTKTLPTVVKDVKFSIKLFCDKFSHRKYSRVKYNWPVISVSTDVFLLFVNKRLGCQIASMVQI